MSKLSSRDPLSILRDMERRSRANATELPQQKVVTVNWSGIGFRIQQALMLVSGSDILEILRYPQITRVAGTQSWVKGIANIRGNLLPIMDFGGFITGDRTKINRTTRILVIDKNGVYVGLVVDEILGQRQFEESLKQALETNDKKNTLGQQYGPEGFELDGDIWRIMEMDRLVADPRFMQVAV